VFSVHLISLSDPKPISVWTNVNKQQTMADNVPPVQPVESVDPVDAGFHVRLNFNGIQGRNDQPSRNEWRRLPCGILHDQFDSFIKSINRPATFEVVPPPLGPINYPYIARQ
jgi:hypothetical protein